MNLPLAERLEKFAQGIARGKTLTQAAIEAGWSAASAGAAGHRASKREDVQRRVKEIRETFEAQRQEALGNVELPTREKILLDLVGAAQIAKESRNLQSYLRALELLGKELGMFVQRSEVKVESPLARLSPEALLALSRALEASEDAEDHIIEGEAEELEPETQAEEYPSWV